MITLYAFGPAFGLPDASPFVMKTEVHLRMAALPYRKDIAGLERAPKGKLPFIADGDVIVADSTLIRDHLERRYDIDLDRGLGARERAEAWAMERMIEDHLGWASAYFRWLKDDNFHCGAARLFDTAPATVREDLFREIREEVAARLTAQGLGLYEEDDIAALGVRSIWALSALLGDKPYLMGERPCGVDAAAYGMLAHIAAPVLRSPLKEAVEGAGNLLDYVARMQRRFHPPRPAAPPGTLSKDLRTVTRIDQDLAPIG